LPYVHDAIPNVKIHRGFRQKFCVVPLARRDLFRMRDDCIAARFSRGTSVVLASRCIARTYRRTTSPYEGNREPARKSGKKRFRAARALQ
jgi:hypothetical protein